MHHEASASASCSGALWETITRNNLVIAHPRGFFFEGTFQVNGYQSLRDAQNQQINGTKCTQVTKDLLQNTCSTQIPSHDLPVTPSISLPQNSVSWMETGMFLLLVFVAEYGQFIHKIFRGHNKLIASSVMVLSCTADYFRTGKILCITTNPQGTEFKRYPMITDL